MSKFCSNCGNKLDENVAFCNKCGNSVNQDNNTNATIINNIYNNNVNVPNKNIALSIVLSIVTCGIYGLYWLCTMNDDANIVSGETSDQSGIMVIILTIITCGIYGFYWNYKMGKKLYTAGQRNNKDISDNSIIYLILSLFGFGIINYCLIQNDLNKFSN